MPVHRHLAVAGILVNGTHFPACVGRFCILADRQTCARQQPGEYHGRDAQRPDWFACLVHGGDCVRHVFLHAALRTGLGKVAQVEGCTETAGHDQGIEPAGIKVRKGLDCAARDARRFHQHIARVMHFGAGQVIHNARLCHVWRKALVARALLV